MVLFPGGKSGEELQESLNIPESTKVWCVRMSRLHSHGGNLFLIRLMKVMIRTGHSSYSDYFKHARPCVFFLLVHV